LRPSPRPSSSTGLTPTEEIEARPILDKLRREAFGPEAELVASQLIRKLRNDPTRCTKCLGPRAGDACKACGHGLARQQRLNDIYIAATDVAAASDGVEVLFTYDRGILSLASHVNRITIQQPPRAGGPLFEQVLADEPSADVAGAKPPRERK
jgi:hypothetical protein